MNHQWANQYVQQRFSDLSAEARGGQLLRAAELDSEDAVSDHQMSLISRLRARMSALPGRKATPVTGSSGR